MEQKNNYANQKHFDISIEDFDALNKIVKDIKENYQKNIRRIK